MDHITEEALNDKLNKMTCRFLDAIDSKLRDLSLEFLIARWSQTTPELTVQVYDHITNETVDVCMSGRQIKEWSCIRKQKEANFMLDIILAESTYQRDGTSEETYYSLFDNEVCNEYWERVRLDNQADYTYDWLYGYSF